MTPREHRVARLFGLEPSRTTDEKNREVEWRRAAAALDRALTPGQLAIIVGPSGAGKSRVLRALARRLGPSATRGGPPGSGSSRSVIDAFGGALGDSMRRLSRGGLGEARVLLTPVAHLSAGQRHRYEIARGVRRAGQASATLIIDEFCSVLDRVTARGVASALRAQVADSRARAVVATAHEDIIDALRPDVLVYVSLDGRWGLCRP